MLVLMRYKQSQEDVYNAACVLLLMPVVKAREQRAILISYKKNHDRRCYEGMRKHALEIQIMDCKMIRGLMISMLAFDGVCGWLDVNVVML
jgi:hypothetical protein